MKLFFGGLPYSTVARRSRLLVCHRMLVIFTVLNFRSSIAVQWKWCQDFRFATASFFTTEFERKVTELNFCLVWGLFFWTMVFFVVACRSLFSHNRPT